MRQRLGEESGTSVSVVDTEGMAYALLKRVHQTTRKWQRKQDGYVEPKKRNRVAALSPDQNLVEVFKHRHPNRPPAYDGVAACWITSKP